MTGEERQFLLTSAWIFMRHGRRDRARGVCEALCEANPHDGVAASALAELLLEDGEAVLAHGIVEYRYALAQLLQDLRWMNTEGDCMVRVVHEVRTRSQQSESSAVAFRDFCAMLEATYPAIRFWCGRNLADWQVDYQFMQPDPSCEELYASVCPPRFDDVWPWLFAWLNNSYIRLQGTDKEVLLIDFIDIE